MFLSGTILGMKPLNIKKQSISQIQIGKQVKEEML